MSFSSSTQSYAAVLDELRREAVCAEAARIELPGDRLPWTPTGLNLDAGTHVTILAAGTLCTSSLGLEAGARFHLWRRIVPGGEVAKGTRDTTSFCAERAGELELAVLNGEWKTPSGELGTPPEMYSLVSGGLEATVIVWAAGVDAATGLKRLRERFGADAGIDAELSRLAEPVRRPRGWRYLWLLGESDSCEAGGNDQGPSIVCRTRNDCAILRHELDVPTSPQTSLGWRWKVDRLPSAVREDELLQHDYLSIAVEWACGRDITYLWSSELEKDTVFTCPIPWWAPRETHVVVRTGTAGIGSWHTEERNLYEDYRRILQDEPGHIVGVWLIAVSIFQQGEGRAEFDSIELRSSDNTIKVI